jgi:hemin uptake protein HemP
MRKSNLSNYGAGILNRAVLADEKKQFAQLTPAARAVSSQALYRGYAVVGRLLPDAGQLYNIKKT